MIFQHTWQQVLDGSKTETRRLVQGADEAIYALKNDPRGIGIIRVIRYSNGYYNTGRIVYEIGNTYAVQPGRGQASVGRVRLLAIRRERVQEISENSRCKEMGIPLVYPGSGPEPYKRDTRQAFANLWDSIHTAKGEQWQDNPEVWVLTFELCKDGKK